MKLSTQFWLLSVVLMLVVVSAEWFDDDPIELPPYVWTRSSRNRRRCVSSGQICTHTYCCSANDICMTGTDRDIDGSRLARCVTWSESPVMQPRLPNGSPCDDSWECANRCCREYRAFRHDVMRECAAPFDGRDWHTCVTKSYT